MSLYAHIMDGVVNALNSQEGYDATDASVKYLWQVVPDGTLPGAIVHTDGTFTNPTVVAPDIVVDVPTFLLLFTSPERIAIRSSTDPIVNDFFSLIDDPRTQRVNLSLTPVKQAIYYLAGLSTPPMTSPVLTTARATAILTGVV